MINQGGSGYGSDSGINPIDERLHELIAAEVTCGILDGTHVIFDTIKKVIMELIQEWLMAFRAKVTVGQVEAQTPLFWEFKVCGAPEFFGPKDPIARWRWITNMENAQRRIFCPEEAKVRFVSYLLKDQVRDWWDKVGRAVGIVAVAIMTWVDFVLRF